MEYMKQGNLTISKGKNIVIVETKLSKYSIDADRELYEFVDSLLDKGYEILDSKRTYLAEATLYHYEDRWVLKSPK